MLSSPRLLAGHRHALGFRDSKMAAQRETAAKTNQGGGAVGARGGGRDHASVPHSARKLSMETPVSFHLGG